jgi:hypothetical protein
VARHHDKKKHRLSYRFVAVLLAIVGIAALAASVFGYWSELHDLGMAPRSDEWGTFGDFVGGFAGTVIALVTLIALAITLDLQARELAAARKVMKTQAYALSKQNFENTLFRILGFIEDRATRLISPRTLTAAGREAFIAHVENLVGRNSGRMKDEELPQEHVLAECRNWYATKTQDLGAYFDLVAEALTRIDRWHMPQSRAVYASILRALLSPAEKYLLFYYGLINHRTAHLVHAHRILEGFDYEAGVAPIPQQRREWFDAAALGA